MRPRARVYACVYARSHFPNLRSSERKRECVSEGIYFALELVSAKRPGKPTYACVCMYSCVYGKKMKNSLAISFGSLSEGLIEIDEFPPNLAFITAHCMHNYERLDGSSHGATCERLNASENDRGIAN